MGARNSAATQEWLVAALKRDVLQEYTQILAQCGLNPVFTLAAQARTALCPQTDLTCALLDIGRCQSELISVEQGNLTAARILPWGGEDITRAIQTRFGINRDEAEQLKTKFPEKTEATVLSEPNTAYDTLVQVMDAVRAGHVVQGAAVVRAELFPNISIGDAPIVKR